MWSTAAGGSWQRWRVAAAAPLDQEQLYTPDDQRDANVVGEGLARVRLDEQCEAQRVAGVVHCQVVCKYGL